MKIATLNAATLKKQLLYWYFDKQTQTFGTGLVRGKKKVVQKLIFQR